MRSALVLLVLATGCATAHDADAPAIAIVERDSVGKGASCGMQPDVARGSVPAGARVLVELELTSARPQLLKTYEELVRLKALEKCAAGARLLRAVDEGSGVTGVTAALYDVERVDAGT